MNQQCILQEYGLVAAFQSVSMMISENVAICGHIYDLDENAEISFMELQMSIDGLSSQLYNRYGVTEGNRVIINCRGYATAEIVACIACARLRATFVPVDSGWMHQGDRLRDIISDCNAEVAIVVANNDSDGIVKTLAGDGIHKCVLLQSDGNIVYDDNWQGLCQIPDIPFTSGSLQPPLYILYTSGSTGKPKGVMGTERGLVNRLIWQAKRFPWHRRNFFGTTQSTSHDNQSSRNCSVSEMEDCMRCDDDNSGDSDSISYVAESDEFDNDDTICRRTPLIFVDALAEIFGALTAGKRLFIPPRSSSTGQVDVSRMLEAMVWNGVTHVTFLPSQLHMLLEDLRERRKKNGHESKTQGGITITSCTHVGADDASGGEAEYNESDELTWTSLRVIFVSGEACPPSTVHLFQELTNTGALSKTAQLVNLYGSTEVAGDVSFSVLSDSSWSRREAPLITSNSDFIPIASGIMDGTMFYIANRRQLTGDTDSTNDSLDMDSYSEYVAADEGQVGELLVSGCHVAAGYVTKSSSLGQDTDNLKFIRRPSSLLKGYRGEPIERVGEDHPDWKSCDDMMYITGDLVRAVVIPQHDKVTGEVTGEGIHIKLVGRNDLQVKARGGVRINLQEMENILLTSLQKMQTSRPGSDPGEEIVAPADDIHYSSIVCTSMERPNAVTSVSEVFITAFIDPQLLAKTGLLKEHASSFGLSRSVTAAFRAAFGKMNIPTVYLPDMVILRDSEKMFRTEVTGKIDRKRFQSEAIAAAKTFFDLMDTSSEISEGLGAGSGAREREGSEVQVGSSQAKLNSTRARVEDEVIGVMAPHLTGLKAPSPLHTDSSENRKCWTFVDWSFVALGGDSMSAQVVLWRLSKLYNKEFDGSVLVEKSISQLIDMIVADMSEDATAHVNEQDQDDMNSMSNKERKRHIGSDEAEYTDASLRSESLSKRSRTIDHESYSPRLLSHNRSRRIVALDSVAKNQTGCDGPSSFRKGHPVDCESEGIADTIQLIHKWKQSLYKCVDAAPLVTLSSLADSNNQMVFGATHGGKVVAMDVVTGEEIWSTELGKNIHVEGGITCDPDFRLIVEQIELLQDVACTASSNDRKKSIPAWPIYLTSYTAQDVDGPSASVDDDVAELSSVGRLWCLDSSTGDILWHSQNTIVGEVKGMPTLTRIPLDCTIASVNSGANYDGSLCSECVDVVLVGSHDGSVYIFTALAGDLVGYHQCDIGSIFAAPVVVGRSVDSGQIITNICVCSTSGYIKSVGLYLTFSEDSIPLLKAVFLSNWSHRSCDSAPIFGTPCFLNTCEVTPCDKETMASDSFTPQSTPLSNRSQSVIIYGTVGGNLCCVSATTGDAIWTHTPLPYGGRESSPIFSSPVVTSVSFSESPGSLSNMRCHWVIFGSHDCCVRAVDVRTGELVWEVPVGAVVYATAQIVTTHHPPRNHSGDLGDCVNGLDTDCGISSVKVIACTTAGDVCLIGSASDSIDGTSYRSNSVETASDWVVLSKVRLRGEIFSSPIFSPSLRQPHDKASTLGTVFVGCRDDCLHCIELLLVGNGSCYSKVVM